MKCSTVERNEANSQCGRGLNGITYESTILIELRKNGNFIGSSALEKESQRFAKTKQNLEQLFYIDLIGLQRIFCTKETKMQHGIHCKMIIVEWYEWCCSHEFQFNMEKKKK